MTRRHLATTIGALFVVQMVSAMIGTSLIATFLDGSRGSAPTAGALFMLISGLSVAAIGLLMYPVLKEVHQRAAILYPALRIIELTVSTVGGVVLLATLKEVPYEMLWIYVPTGLGGLVLNYLLWVGRLVPRPIAALGLVGYALLTLGVPLDLLGVLAMDEGPGQALLAPGGLFELFVLPAWLIMRGFTSADPAGAETRIAVLV